MPNSKLFEKLCSSRFRVEPKVEVQIVAWLNWNEWKDLKDCLYSDVPKEMRRGVRMAQSMRIRRKVPVGLDYTAKFIEAHLKAGKHPEFAVELLSYALIRFVSAVTGMKQDQYYHKNMDDIAEEINLDVELIELRHNCIHGQQPSRAELERAVDIALNWLREEYWEPQNASIVDYLEPSDIAERHAEMREEFKEKLENAVIDWLILSKSESKQTVIQLLNKNYTEFFSVLAQEESPIFREDIIGKKNTDFPSSALRRRGRRLLKCINEDGKAEVLVSSLVAHLDDNYDGIMQWLALVVWDVDARDEVSWRQHIPEILRSPGPMTAALMKLVFPRLNPKLKKSEERLIVDIVNTYVGTSKQRKRPNPLALLQQVDSVEDMLNPQTLVESPAPTKKRKTQPEGKKLTTWTLVEEEWDTPIGLIPGQTVESLRLEFKEIFSRDYGYDD